MFEDLTGKQFNNWFVLGFSHKDSKRNYWECECQCEKKTKRIICTYNLVHGLTKSCGCSLRKDLMGRKFNSWTVIGFSHVSGGKSYWKCQCECGTTAIKRVNQLTQGISKDCGCSKAFKLQNIKNSNKELKMNTRISSIWYGMHDRCQNPNHSKYHNYGGRGIKICEEWYDFNNFYQWAISNGYAKNLELDRIDVDGNYSPDNCRWITHKKQCDNKRNTLYITVNGATHTINEWSKITGIKRNTLMSRYLRKELGVNFIRPLRTRAAINEPQKRL